MEIGIESALIQVVCPQKYPYFLTDFDCFWGSFRTNVGYWVFRVIQPCWRMMRNLLHNFCAFQVAASRFAGGTGVSSCDYHEFSEFTEG